MFRNIDVVLFEEDPQSQYMPFCRALQNLGLKNYLKDYKPSEYREF